jgi:putative mRNA 3-end processing factor
MPSYLAQKRNLNARVQDAMDWVKIDRAGLSILPAAAHIDPLAKVQVALITHGHADHARPGHHQVIATPETLAIMATRYGDDFAEIKTPLRYGEKLKLGDVHVGMAPSGHILGSAQIIVEYQNTRLIAAGDYKRKSDPTCAAFEIVPCDIFITEATFGLPVFRHPDPKAEIERLLKVKSLFPERSILIGAYALGKAQRVIALLRAAGYNAPIYIHGALQNLCNLYQEYGVELGELHPATSTNRGEPSQELEGAIIIAPPSAMNTVWARRLSDPLNVFASGWMQVRQRAKQRGVEFPLILSDHADWDDLLETIEAVNPGEVWVTHGREDALIHACQQRGISARALSLIGYDEAME